MNNEPDCGAYVCIVESLQNCASPPPMPEAASESGRLGCLLRPAEQTASGCPRTRRSPILSGSMPIVTSPLNLDAKSNARAAPSCRGAGALAVILCTSLTFTGLCRGAVINEVTILAVNPYAKQVRVHAPAASSVRRGTEIILFKGVEPTSRGILVRAGEGESVFHLRDVDPNIISDNKLRAWMLPHDLIAAVRSAWPVGAGLLAEIDSVGPSDRSLWLRAGQDFGLQAGDTCLVKVGRQPAARIDLRFVGPDVSFGCVTALVADLKLTSGMQAALWPAPGEARSGRATSFVSFVEKAGRDVQVWVPAVPHVSCPDEPHLDYFRGDRLIGSGVVTRQDDRFWYASFRAAPSWQAPGAGRETTQPSSPRSASPPVASTPASAPTEEVLPQLGDHVVVRTDADIERRRFVAQVFEVTTGGALLDAGENDGLAVGQEGKIYREGAVVGRIEVVRAQPTYAVIVSRAKDRESAVELRLGDEVRFGPPPPAPTEVGTIVRVTARDLITVRLTVAQPPLGTPLAVKARGQTAAVALLIVAEDGLAGGFVIPASVTVPPAAGMQLVLEAEE